MKLFYSFCAACIRGWFGTIWGGVEVRGRENVPAAGRLVVACNHVSFCDPMIAGSFLGRELHFMARDTLFRNPFFRLLIRSLNAFPIERSPDGENAMRSFAAAMHKIGEELERDNAVLLFPEGTRSEDGRLLPLKPGVAMISSKFGAPVLPLYLWGTYHCLPRGSRFPRRHRIVAYAGTLLRPIDVDGRRERRREQERLSIQLEEEMRRLEALALSERVGEPPDV